MTRATHLDPAAVPATDAAVATSAAPPAKLAGEAEETFVLPASAEQSRYWMLAQIDPGSTASNMAISCEIAGVLDPLIVEQAIAALTLRHEALRTLFRMVDGQLSQIILTRPLYEFAQQDLTGADGRAVAEADLAAVLSTHSHAGIDLEHGPVLRVRLFRLAPERHVLALTMSHIVCDGWSNGLLLRDLLRLYQALQGGSVSLEKAAAGPASGLPELPFQFADFTLWQNEYLTSDRALAALRFWTSHVRRDLPALDMPADHPRQAGRSFPGTIASALLPASLNDTLSAYCRTSGSTKHIVLLAAFQALCARFSGQQQFLLGSTIANRTQPGMEDVVGRFANPQIVVANVDGDPSFRELEMRVREWGASAYTHQDLPFSRIIEDFQMGQAGAGAQFLQVWFVYQRAFMQPQEAAGLQLTPLRSVSGGVDFDLLVSVVERAEGSRLQIEYNTDLFDRARIDGLLAAFSQLLTAALATPERPLSQIELGVASTPASFTADAPVAIPSLAKLPTDAAVASAPTGAEASAWPEIDLSAHIAAQAAAQPQQIAVRAGIAELTWQELEERSSALAAHLQRGGYLARAARALLVLTPEVESAVSLLALLKCSNSAPRTEAARTSPLCIVPLPAHTSPEDLRAALADDTLVLAPSRLLQEMSLGAAHAVAYEGIVTLPAATPAPSLPGGSAVWSMPHLRADSDSATIEPVRHAFADTLHSVAAVSRRLHLGSTDALLAVAPASPADALFDLLLALLSGGTVELTAYHPDLALQTLLNQGQITAVLAEPAHWRAWIAQGWSGDRRVSAIARGRHSTHPWLGAEAVSLRAAMTLLATSAGVFAVAGRSLDFTPLPGVTLTVLDPQHTTVPTGATGELTLARGQRTGYLAQAGATGAFRILGETAAVVQLHGHRMRLTDLEAALLRSPGVLDAVAVFETRKDGAPQIAAWFVQRTDLPTPWNTDQLRRELATQLPQQLVPASLQSLAALPYRIDGSIDTAKLRDTATLRSLEDAAPSAAIIAATDASIVSDDLSRELTDIWKDVLNLDAVDTQATFFEAGGNSLLLVRLFARINKAFGTRLPITTIFDAENLAKLSARLRQQGEIRSLVPVQPHGHRPPVFMIHSYLLYQGLSQALGRTQPFYGLRELEADSELTMQQRVTNYVREIREAHPHGPYSVMGWCAAGPLTVEVARQLLEAGETISSVILFDSWLPGYLNSVEDVTSSGSFLPKFHGIRSKLRRHNEKMSPLSLGQRVRYVRNAAVRYALNSRNRFFIQHWSGINMLAARFHLPLPQFMYNTTLTTFAALNAYRPHPVPIRLTLIRAHDTREVPGASAACGWEQVAMHGVDVLWAPGDHETMFLGEKLEATTELVRRCLQHANLPGPQMLTTSAAVALRDGRLLQVGSL